MVKRIGPRTDPWGTPQVRVSRGGGRCVSSEGDTLGPAGQVRPKPVQGSVPDAESMVKSVKKCGVVHKVKSHRAIKQRKKDRFFGV